MKINFFRKALMTAACGGLILFSVSVVHAEDTSGADSPLKAEMRQLDVAFKNVIDDLLLGNLSVIESHLHEIDALRQSTHEALEKGKLKLEKNGKKTKVFEEMDGEFHEKLERLVAASKKGDKKAVKRITHRLLDACIRCHEAFRK